MKEHYRYLFEERAGILEYDCGMSREKATRLAFLETVENMTRARFFIQTSVGSYQEFKHAEHEMIYKTLYSWNIKVS